MRYGLQFLLQEPPDNDAMIGNLLPHRSGTPRNPRVFSDLHNNLTGQQGILHGAR